MVPSPTWPYQRDSPARRSPAAGRARRSPSDGNRQEHTEYHTVISFGRLAEICAAYCAKGQRMYIEGRQPRSGRAAGAPSRRPPIALGHALPKVKREPVEDAITLPGIACSASRAKVAPLQCIGTR